MKERKETKRQKKTAANELQKKIITYTNIKLDTQMSALTTHHQI
jgi:hypothetical protein